MVEQAMGRRGVRSETRIERLEQRLKPVVVVALIAMVLLLFIVHATAILSQPLPLPHPER